MSTDFTTHCPHPSQIAISQGSSGLEQIWQLLTGSHGVGECFVLVVAFVRSVPDLPLATVLRSAADGMLPMTPASFSIAVAPDTALSVFFRSFDCSGHCSSLRVKVHAKSIPPRVHVVQYDVSGFS
jgi:hypothetical protein